MTYSDLVANRAADRALRVVGTLLLSLVVFMLTAAGYSYGGWWNAAGCFIGLRWETRPNDERRRAR